MKKELLWYGPAYSFSGYATHNRYMLLGLEDLGWKIKLVGTEKNIPETLIGKERLIKMTKNVLSDEKNAICVNLVPPPGLPAYGKHTILFTTLESLTVHEGYLRRCQQYDEVWVPCRDNYLSMLNAGWPSRKLHLIPEGYDDSIYSPGQTPLPGVKSDKFTFMFVGDWSYRKGIQWMIPAFCKAFTKEDNVRLLISSHYQGGEDERSRARIRDEYQEILQKNKITDPPNIEFIYDWIPDDKLGEFYNSADCMVLLSCGEAWALPLMQGMASGIPAITTSWGGQNDYINKKNGYPVKIKKFDTIHDKIKLSVDFYWYQLFAFPDVEDATKQFRRAYDNQADAKKKGERAQREVSKKYTWKQAALKANKRLEKICKSLT